MRTKTKPAPPKPPKGYEIVSCPQCYSIGGFKKAGDKIWNGDEWEFATGLGEPFLITGYYARRIAKPKLAKPWLKKTLAAAAVSHSHRPEWAGGKVKPVTKSEVKAWRKQPPRCGIKHDEPFASSYPGSGHIMDDHDAGWADAQEECRKLIEKWNNPPLGRSCTERSTLADCAREQKGRK